MWINMLIVDKHLHKHVKLMISTLLDAWNVRMALKWCITLKEQGLSHVNSRQCRM